MGALLSQPTQDLIQMTEVLEIPEAQDEPAFSHHKEYESCGIDQSLPHLTSFQNSHVSEIPQVLSSEEKKEEEENEEREKEMK